jgi:hypothetical protein
MEKGILLTL